MSDQVIVLLVVTAIAAWVVADRVRNRLSQCSRCKGAGILKSTFFSGRYRPCPRCGRSGEVERTRRGDR